MALAGCGRREPDSRLLRADSLMWSRPDSALALIDSIDESTLRGNDDRALRALLLTQARHKNNIFETDDSLIQTAVKYYDDHGPDSCIMLAHFYRAAVLNSAEVYDTALIENLKALDIAKALNDVYWMARAYEQISDNYYLCYNIAGAIPYLDSAVTCYDKANRKLNALYAQISLARSYGHNKDDSKAIAILDLLDITNFSTDSTLLIWINESYIRPLIHLRRYDEAAAHFQKVLDLRKGELDPMVYLPDVVELYINLNHADTARYYLDCAKFKKEVNVQYGGCDMAEYMYQRAFGTPERALVALEAANSKFDVVNESSLENNLAFIEKEYYNVKMQLKQREEERNRLWLIFGIIFTLFITIVGLSVYQIMLRNKRREIINLTFGYNILQQNLSDKSREEEKLRTFIDEKEATLTEVKAQLNQAGAVLADTVATLERQMNDNLKWESMAKNLMKRQHSLIDELAEHLDKGKASSNAVYKCIQNKMAIYKTPEMRQQLERLVNDCFDNVIVKMREQLPKFKEADIWFVTLKLAGFSQHAICLFADMTIGNYYNKWTRLRKRILDSDSPNKEIFYALLSPKT